uniref:E3 ubiquitin ligase UBR4 C-terminal domain-containing protein n=1 Tax=Tetraselmis chuii TaxID=63592 RepID=A0A7S1X4P1_9CHLO
MLASMGMQQVKSPSGQQTIVAVSPGSELAKAMAELEEEDEDDMSCMVCREGYKVQPSSLLGVYCFCKRTSAPPSRRSGTGVPSTRGGSGVQYSTVSHFNLIHISCHAAARRADSALRQPKREWEGATRRNGDTLCNNLLPVPGPKTSADAYAAAATTFWDNLAALGPGGAGRSSRANATSRMLMLDVEMVADGAVEDDGSAEAAAGQVALVGADIAALIDRFATGASFSVDARGGGRESNARLVPYLVKLGRHAAQRCTPSDLSVLMAGVNDFCGTTPPLSERPLGSALPPASPTSTPGASSPASGRDVPEACHVMGMALLLQPPREWAASRRAVLWNLLLATFQNYCRAASAASRGGPGRAGELAARQQLATAPEGVLLEVAAPALVTFALVDGMQRLVKPGPGSPDAEEGAWGDAVASKLADLPACVAGASELLGVLDDLADAGSAMEAFDIVGALAEAMQGGASAEDFLRDIAS